MSDEQPAEVTANCYGMISLADHDIGRILTELHRLGPGVPKGRVTGAPASSLDFGTTFLDMAGVARPEHRHGRPILPVARGEERRAVRACRLSGARCAPRPAS